MNEFKETQRFNQWWVWMIGLFPIVIVISEFTAVLSGKEQVNTEDVFAFTIIIVIILLSFLWIKMLRLETIITKNEIRADFKGLFFAKRIIQWSEIEKAEVIKYDPLFEYGGWGVKYGLKKGWCYNVAGDMGLRLYLKNGKMFLIGTQKQRELQQFLVENNL